MIDRKEQRWKKYKLTRKKRCKIGKYFVFGKLTDQQFFGKNDKFVRDPNSGRKIMRKMNSQQRVIF